MKKAFLLFLVILIGFGCSDTNEPESKSKKGFIPSESKPNDLVPMAIGNYWEYLNPDNEKVVIKVLWNLDNTKLKDTANNELDYNLNLWEMIISGKHFSQGFDLWGFENKKLIMAHSITKMITKDFTANKNAIFDSDNFDFIDVSDVETNLGIAKNCLKYSNRNHISNEEDEINYFFKEGIGIVKIIYSNPNYKHYNLTISDYYVK